MREIEVLGLVVGVLSSWKEDGKVLKGDVLGMFIRLW